MSQITLNDLPIVYGHSSRGGHEVGRVKKTWIDSDGWMRVVADIDTSTLSGRATASQVAHGHLGGLSLTHEYFLKPRMYHEPGYFESKTFTEVAILPPDQIERTGCLVENGEHIEIDDQDRISESSIPPARPPSSSSMGDLKEKAELQLELEKAKKDHLELAAELKKFNEGAREQDARMADMDLELKAGTEREKALTGQVDAFFSQQREQLSARQQELADLLPQTPETKTALDNLTALARTPEEVASVGAAYVLVADNMRMPRDDQEATLQGFKHQLNRESETASDLAEARKRYRPSESSKSTSSRSTSSSSGSSGATVKTSLRNMAALQRFEQLRGEGGL